MSVQFTLRDLLRTITVLALVLGMLRAAALAPAPYGGMIVGGLLWLGMIAWGKRWLDSRTSSLP